MKYVLQILTQDIFLEFILNSTISDEIEINELIEGCKYYYHEVHGNTYFLTKTNETKIRRNALSKDYIERVYALIEDHNFILEELEADFIDYMIFNYQDKTSTLDEDIFNSQNAYLTRYE